MVRPSLSAVGEIVRRHDPDRYLTALFAPAPHRETLFTLYAFNHELARAREVVREPMMAMIRLQWWREVVEGAHRAHEVAGPVSAALQAGSLMAQDLEAMIVAREMETEPIETMADFEAYVLGSAGGVMVAAGRALCMADPEVLRPWGAAVGTAGVLRNVPALARQGRSVLPVAVLAEAGLTPAQAVADPRSAMSAARGRLVGRAAAWLDTSPAVPAGAAAAALPVILARRDLSRGPETAARGLGDRIAVYWAGLTGRL